MKIINAQLAAKSIKGVFPYEFTYEDGSKGIYLPDNQMEHEGSFKTAQEVYETITGLLGTNTSTQTFK